MKLTVRQTAEALFRAAEEGDPKRIAVNFWQFLLRRKMTDRLTPILTALKKIYREKRQWEEVVCETSREFDDGFKSEIKKLAEKHCFPVKAKYIFRVNPNLIGGIRLACGDRQLDLSIAEKLKQLKESICQTN